MSRTDAHRPAWVQKFDPSMPAVIEHDHRRGECRVESFDEARDYATSRTHPRWRYPHDFAPCQRSWSRGYGWQVSVIYGEHVPGDVCNDYERMDRQDGRRVLRAAARDYNANGNTELEPVPARHRHKGIWHFW